MTDDHATDTVTTRDLVEEWLTFSNVARVAAVPFAEVVDYALEHPDWLVLAALAMSTSSEQQVQDARRLAHCVAVGLQPETIDGKRWFLPGSEAP